MQKPNIIPKFNTDSTKVLNDSASRISGEKSMGIFNNAKKLFEKNAESIAKDAGKLAAEVVDEVATVAADLEKKVDQTVKKS